MISCFVSPSHDLNYILGSVQRDVDMPEAIGLEVPVRNQKHGNDTWLVDLVRNLHLQLVYHTDLTETDPNC